MHSNNNDYLHKFECEINQQLDYSKIKEMNSSFYDYIAKTNPDVYEIPCELIDEFIEKVKEGGRILDAGGGTGNISLVLAKRGFEIWFNDLSLEMIKKSKTKLKDFSIKYLPGDMKNLDIPADYFDGIITSFSIFHFPCKKLIKEMLNKFNKFLKRKGIMFISIQSSSKEIAKVFEHPDFKRDVFLYVIPYSKFEELLRETSFEIILKSHRSPHENEWQFEKYFFIVKKI